VPQGQVQHVPGEAEVVHDAVEPLPGGLDIAIRGAVVLTGASSVVGQLLAEQRIIRHLTEGAWTRRADVEMSRARRTASRAAIAAGCIVMHQRGNQRRPLLPR